MKPIFSNHLRLEQSISHIPRSLPSYRTKSKSRVVPCSNRPGLLVSRKDEDENENENVADVIGSVQGEGGIQSKSTKSTVQSESDDGQKNQIGKYDFKSLGIPALGVAALIGVVAVTALFKEDISQFLESFIKTVEEMGPAGGLAYAGLYILLETIAVPATPLTLTAGYLFGQIEGTLIVSLSATTAALIAFLISRYGVRDKIVEMAAGNKQFVAIDRAIKKDGFKFVFLLRLSPLLPFAASNYLYGLTSIEAGPYVLASWLGMLPGTYAYVSAGSVSREIFSGGSATFSPWEIGLALSVTFACIWFAGNVAKKALDEAEEEP